MGELSRLIKKVDHTLTKTFLPGLLLNPDNPDNEVRVLKDYGITEKESSRAQQLSEHQLKQGESSVNRPGTRSNVPVYRAMPRYYRPPRISQKMPRLR